MIKTTLAVAFSAALILTSEAFSEVFPAESESVTFSDALSRLYSSNEALKASAERVSQTRFEKKAAEGLYYPTLSLNAGYVRFDKDLDVKVDLNDMKKALAPIAITFPQVGPLIASFPSSLSQTIQKKQLFILDATAIWPVFTGGKIRSANKAASLLTENAENQAASVKEKLGSGLAEVYFGTRLAESAVTVRKESYETMLAHYYKAVKMEEAGIIARVERMHAEVAVSDAKRAYDQSVRQLRLISAVLKSTINSPEEVKPSTPLFIIPSEFLENLSFFQDKALAMNPEIKMLDVGEKLGRTAVSNEKSAYFPSVFLFGNASLYSYDKSDTLPDWTVGVALNYNIFEGFSGYNKVRAAKAAERSVSLTRIRARKDLKTLVESRYIEMENARADYQAVQASLAFTEEYLRARVRAFDNGMATSVDVVDAELALSAAKMEALEAAYKFDTALARLLETSGIFGEFEDYRSRATVELGL